MASLIVDLFRSLLLRPLPSRATEKSPSLVAGDISREAALRLQVKQNPGDMDSFGKLCDLLWQGRRNAELEALVKSTKQISRDSSLVMLNEFRLAYRQGDTEEALAGLQTMLGSADLAPDVHAALGEIYLDLGNFPAAEHHLRTALILDAKHAGARYALARLAVQRGNLAAAIIHFESVSGFYQDQSEFLNDFANTLTTAGRLQEAVALYRQILCIRPDLVGTRNNLATALRTLGLHHEAMEQLETALGQSPDHPVTLCNLAAIYLAQGEFQISERLARLALEKAPDNLDASFALGNALLGMSRLVEAENVFAHATELAPDNPAFHNNLGHARWEQGKMGLAIEAFETALRVSPVFAGAASNLGAALQECGRLEDACAAYRQALEINPSLTLARSNLIFALHYRHGDNPTLMYKEHLNWERFHVTTTSSEIFPPKPKGQALRVGYVSGDLRRHSVGYFIEPLLECHNPSCFEVYCYSNSAAEDEVSARLQRYVKRWRNIYGVDDESCRRMIREDGIDILVDLSGHSSGARLGLFAPRSAQVQVSFLGYPNTTGLSTMDARLVDAYTDPIGTGDCYHTERLIRLDKGFLCYRPPDGAPTVATLPALARGYITFVCFNAFAKLSPDILRVWARILQAIPNSRLLVKSLALADESVRQHAEGLFLDAGINLERVEFLGRVQSTVEHLEHYHRGDIALDPYPYNGTTTTFESLYMGLPVISLAGNTHVSRVSGSILTTLGHGNWVADNEEKYIHIAMSLASDLQELAEIRSGLRQELLASDLCDGVKYARKVESAYAALLSKANVGAESLENQGLSETPPQRLHLGGIQAKPGWSIVNIQPGPSVDIVGDISDLSGISDASIAEVYASHVLEHLGYLDRLPKALAEVYRVLAFGGRFFISVPDLDVLAGFILDQRLSSSERFQVMRMMFGGQIDPHDYHHVGLNFEIIESYLKDFGFSEVRRVEEFHLFDDTSSLRMHGRLISLNVIAIK